MSNIEWTCDICEQPVKDGTGYVQISYHRMSEYRQDVKQWKQAHPKDPDLGGRLLSLDGLLSHPRPVRWEVLHQDCDPDPNEETEATYWFDIDRCRTHAQLLDWTAHLMGKRWLKDTDWEQFIRRALSPVKGRPTRTNS